MLPAVAAIIQYGDLSDIELSDEPDLLVQSLTITPTRDKQVWKGDNQAVQVLRFVNPILSFQFNAIIAEDAGLAAGHPGELVMDLANYRAARFGFDPAEGVLVYEDPVMNLSLDDPAEINFTVAQYPFVGSPGEMLFSSGESVAWSDDQTVQFSS